MQTWLDHTPQHVAKGENFISNSVSALFRGWQPLILPAVVINTLCTGAERWQAVARQVEPSEGLADILRARTF